jgi:hypothetical protein
LPALIDADYTVVDRGHRHALDNGNWPEPGRDTIARLNGTVRLARAMRLDRYVRLGYIGQPH